ncbi:MAG: hypothetical protein AMXMBFR33_51690 [Candidatus Xenobia bacterium]|jgi:hypothetical protein
MIQIGAPTPRSNDLRDRIQAHELHIAAWQPMLDMYTSEVNSCEAAVKTAKKSLTKSCLWVAGGLTGIAVGLSVPGANLAALVGFGCFFKGWRDSYQHLMEVRVYKSERAFYQKRLDHSLKAVGEVKSLLNQAREALVAGEAEDEVRRLGEGIKRASAIFESDKEVHLPGVRLKKRGAQGLGAASA